MSPASAARYGPVRALEACWKNRLCGVSGPTWAAAGSAMSVRASANAPRQRGRDAGRGRMFMMHAPSRGSTAAGLFARFCTHAVLVVVAGLSQALIEHQGERLAFIQRLKRLKNHMLLCPVCPNDDQDLPGKMRERLRLGRHEQRRGVKQDESRDRKSTRLNSS